MTQQLELPGLVGNPNVGEREPGEFPQQDHEAKQGDELLEASEKSEQLRSKLDDVPVDSVDGDHFGTERGQPTACGGARDTSSGGLMDVARRSDEIRAGDDRRCVEFELRGSCLHHGHRGSRNNPDRRRVGFRGLTPSEMARTRAGSPECPGKEQGSRNYSERERLKAANHRNKDNVVSAGTPLSDALFYKIGCTVRRFSSMETASEYGLAGASGSYRAVPQRSRSGFVPTSVGLVFKPSRSSPSGSIG